MSELTLYGAHLSPYVRKVRLALAVKELDYKHVIVIPFQKDHPPEFTQNSPLRKIPLLKAGDQFIPDSSVICQYLERAYPATPLLPEDAGKAARALWFEEYADSHMTAVIAGHLFAEKILAGPLFNRAPNEDEIALAINEEIPGICAYLESQLEGDYLVDNTLTLADLAVGGLFVAMHHCDVACDAAKFPKVAAYIDRLLSHPAFVKTMQEEEMMLKMLSA
ncbi:MAG: glutathione S-transferase family protein [Oleiphilaceae bacterium]|nr:glutathione S-transferase family protein [Oleiphilaceae bacterium]